jgi:predicted metal-dependent hydrolase
MFSAYFFTVALPALKIVLALAALFAFVWFALSLYAHAGQQYASTEQKAALLKAWYRTQLKSILAELVPKWEAILGVKAREVKVHTMKTKWGSCNTDSGKILFNIELAKKPIECIEYVVVHELLHLIERKHNDLFKAYLDKYVPNWVQVKAMLNT